MHDSRNSRSGVGVGEQSEEPLGSARLELVDGVRLLHPEDAVLQGILDGWEKQLRGGRGLAPGTISGYLSSVRQFLEFTNEYPWNWTAAHMDEWMTDLVTTRKAAKSTIRNHQIAMRTFNNFLLSPHYHCVEECERRFGTHSVQICHEWNTVAHVTDYEGGADRRPMTREELQRFFTYADEQVERAIRMGRKGALQAYRDATVFKVISAWGLRCTEASKLDVTDWYRNPKAPELGNYGMLHVRWGKASRGSPPKRQPVASVMPWAVEAVEDYLVNIRPRFGFATVVRSAIAARPNRMSTTRR